MLFVRTLATLATGFILMTSGAVYAAQGKLEGLGPLKLGISEQEVYRTLGQSSKAENATIDLRTEVKNFECYL
jgi:hypothetical protein